MSWSARLDALGSVAATNSTVPFLEQLLDPKLETKDPASSFSKMARETLGETEGKVSITSYKTTTLTLECLLVDATVTAIHELGWIDRWLWLGCEEEKCKTKNEPE